MARCADIVEREAVGAVHAVHRAPSDSDVIVARRLPPRAGTMSAAPPAAPPPPDVEEFNCPVCLRLLCKPSVLPCGHALCFWDAHRSMDAFGTSHCPVCRRAYRHLPAVCEALHGYLGRTFPREYAERLRENLDEEEEMDHFSPELPAALILPRTASASASTPPAQHHPPTADTLVGTTLIDALAAATPSRGPNLRLFACAFDDGRTDAGPAPGRSGSEPELGPGTHILHDPVVLACGHAVCRGCERRRMGTSPGTRRECPRCGRPDPTGEAPPEPSLLLAELVRRACGNAPAEAAAARDAAWDAAHPPATAPDVKEPTVETKPEPGSENASGGTGGGAPRTFERFLESVRRVDPESFTHIGVGCDVCGMYPIRGRRFRCMDCPESMGFDLCVGCHRTAAETAGEDEDEPGDGAGPGGGPGAGGGVDPRVIHGRFNQNHRPDHRMEEVRPRPTAMHFLTHMHPDLTPAQILEMVRLQTAPEPADEPAGADSADVDDAETDLNLDDEDDVDVDEDDVDVDEDDGEFLWLDEEGADVPAEEEETEDEREVNDVERTSPSSGPGPSPGGRDELDAARGERATAAI